MGDLSDPPNDDTMSYTRKNGDVQVALGGALDTVMSAVKSVSGSVDPYLPEAFCRVDQIRALRQDRTALQAMFGKRPTVPVPVCVKMPPNMKGVGVEKAIRPLRAVVYLEQHPGMVWLGLTAALAIPFFAGYTVGRMKK